MRYLQYLVVLFAISFVPSLVACGLSPNDSQSSDELAVQSEVESPSSAEHGSIEVDLNGPAAALLKGAPSEGVEGGDISISATCPPPGTWSGSCPEWACSGTLLCARCRQRNGQLTEGVSCIDVGSCGSVNNCNGHLQCRAGC
jgi:hypothetical protein